MSGVLVAKVVAMALLGAVSLFLGLLPLVLDRCCGLKIRKQKDVAPEGHQHQTPSGKAPRGRSTTLGETVISCLSCFCGGVILTTCFTHMLPEVNLFLKKNFEQGTFSDNGMPLAEIFVLCGFFLIYVTEEVTHLLIDYMHSSKKNASKKKNAHHLTAKGKVDIDGNGSIPVSDLGQSLKDEEGLPLKQNDEERYHHGDHVDIADLVADENNSFQVTLRGFLVILALSLHELFEGIALGLTHTESSVWYLLFAIAVHKYLIAFCLGMQFVSSGISVRMTAIFISTFSLITPLGAGVGIAISESGGSDMDLQLSSVTVLQGIATGTLLYVTFFEIFDKERHNDTNNLLQAGCAILGFALMVLLQLMEPDTSGDAKESVGTVICLKGRDMAPSCTLTHFNASWTLPMNFTCSSQGLVDSYNLIPSSEF